MKHGFVSLFRTDTFSGVWQTMVNVGDLEFKFVGFSRLEEANHEIQWTAEIIAVDVYGAQKEAHYFQGWAGEPGYYIVYFFAGPEREVTVGKWTISGKTKCPCPRK